MSHRADTGNSGTSREEAEQEGAINISENCRNALAVKLENFGLSGLGGTITFVIEANKAYRTEVLYFRVKFPPADARTNTFHSYTPDEKADKYSPYEVVSDGPDDFLLLSKWSWAPQTVLAGP